MITVRRAAERTRTDHDGISTWHCFSSGAHYDPGDVSFGPVIACDEHLVAPGAGFDRHAHAHVELLSWVLDGELRHEDAMGRAGTIRPGEVQYQLAGSPIEHTERNASATVPLRFVQLWLLTAADDVAYGVAPPPIALRSGRLSVLDQDHVVEGAGVFGYVGAGTFSVGDNDLRPGDSLRARDERLAITGAGQLLVVTFDPAD